MPPRQTRRERELERKKKASSTNEPPKSNEGKKKEKIAFPNRPWVGWMTIIIAFLGFAGGVWNTVYQIIIDKPKFMFSKIGGITYTSNNEYDTVSHTFFLVSGSIGNDGKKPLFPQYYLCTAIDKQTGEEYDLSVTMPDSTFTKFVTEERTIYLDSVVSTNLGLVQKISATDAAFGNLLFVNDRIITDAAHKAFEFKITCVDIFHKKYVSRFELDFNDKTQSNRPMVFPGYKGRSVPNKPTYPPPARVK